MTDHDKQIAYLPSALKAASDPWRLPLARRPSPATLAGLIEDVEIRYAPSGSSNWACRSTCSPYGGRRPGTTPRHTRRQLLRPVNDLGRSRACSRAEPADGCLALNHECLSSLK